MKQKYNQNQDSGARMNHTESMIDDYSGVHKEPRKSYRYIYLALATALTCVLMYYYAFARIGTLEIRGIFVAAILMLCFFPKSADATWKQVLDCVLVILSVIVNIYFIMFNYDMKMKFFSLDIPDIIMGLTLVVLILEGTRRKLGLAMPVIALVFLLYGFFGYLIPGRYGISQLSVSRIVSILYTGTEGIYGTTTGIMVSTVFMFVLFGGLLQTTGAGQFFIDIAKAFCGKSAGGPAKIAVISSMMFGSISGSAVANTVATGTFTIPMMKDSGYKASFAGAVEAAASTGGQMMPPIMGAGAFLIAEMTGTPYSTVVLISIIPALLYYAAVFLTVHLEARKQMLSGLAPEEIPSAKKVLLEQGLSAIPLLLLVVLVVFLKFSVVYAAVFSVASLLVIGIIKNKEQNKLLFILRGIEEASSSIVSVSMSCVCAGIIVGMISLTGLGYNFSNTLIGLASGHMFLALVLVLLMGIVLGMGLPTTAAFILMISVAGPGLVGIGLPMMVAYMVTFWFSQTSAITPPVCLAAYAAAGIARAKPMDVGIQSIRIGFPMIVIPFLMAYRSLLFNGTLLETAMTVLTGSLGIISVCIATTGFFKVRLKWYEYILAVIACVGTFWPTYLMDAIGVFAFVLLLVSQFSRYGHEHKNILQ